MQNEKIDGFNSKLVRLEESTLAFCADIAHVQFQFQTGAIRSLFLCKQKLKLKGVSIPNWCD